MPIPADSPLDILRSAVHIARSQRLQSVQPLIEQLQEIYPGRDSDIRAALTLWAQQVRASMLH